MRRVHERYRQTTDDRRQTVGRTTTYSEHEHEFMRSLKIKSLRRSNGVDVPIYGMGRTK